MYTMEAVQKYDSFKQAVEDLPSSLTDEPYPAIYNHYENIFKNAGEKVFKFAALQILSPYAPLIKYAGDEQRISVNILLLANSGGGKTEMMKKVYDIAPEGKVELVQKQTAKALQDKVTDRPEGVEILVNDMKTIMGDSELLKTYETVIADGFVRRETAREETGGEDKKVRAAMIAGVVPDDVSDQIYGGLIFRTIPIEVSYSKEEQKEIMQHITDNISSDSNPEINSDNISDLYDILYHGIKGNYQDMPRINGYKFDDGQREKILNAAYVAIDELGQLDKNVNLFRQLWDGFRLSALHALLNLHNRDVEVSEEDGREVGKVCIEDKDAKVGATLMQVELDTLNGYLQDSKVRKQLEKLDSFKSSGQFSTNLL